MQVTIRVFKSSTLQGISTSDDRVEGHLLDFITCESFVFVPLIAPDPDLSSTHRSSYRPSTPISLQYRILLYITQHLLYSTLFLNSSSLDHIMSSPVTNPIQTSPNALTPGLHISTFPVSSAAASSILELIRSTRGSAEREPVSIPLTAHPGVKEGKDQCMKCGIFGHRSYQCGQFSTSAEPVTDWRRTTNGKIYSVKALLGMPPYCKWTMDTVLEDSSK